MSLFGCEPETAAVYRRGLSAILYFASSSIATLSGGCEWDRCDYPGRPGDDLGAGYSLAPTVVCCVLRKQALNTRRVGCARMIEAAALPLTNTAMLTTPPRACCSRDALTAAAPPAAAGRKAQSVRRWMPPAPQAPVALHPPTGDAWPIMMRCQDGSPLPSPASHAHQRR